MSFFPHYAPFFLFSAPSKWNVFFRITEIGAHKLRLHAPFTMDIIKGRLLFDAFSDVFMSCICFADTVNICGNKHIFIVIVIVIVIVMNVVGFPLPNHEINSFTSQTEGFQLSIELCNLWQSWEIVFMQDN